MNGEGEIGDLLRGHLSGLELAFVEPVEIMEPYRGLLCHDHDMTSTLAKFHGGQVELEVLKEDGTDEAYVREVLLKVGGKPVEYGVIRIFLERFPDGARKQIVSGGKPLGAILNDGGMVYESRPIGFLKIRSESFAPDFFPASIRKFLFGRYNQLLGADGSVLARIIEILPIEQP